MTGLKMYRVTVEHTFYMVSDEEPDEFEIDRVAAESIRDSADPFEMGYPVEVKSVKDIEKSWRDSIPYGESPLVDGTCVQVQEWIEAAKAGEVDKGKP